MYNHSPNLKIFIDVFCGVLIFQFSKFAVSSKLNNFLNGNFGALCPMCEDGQVDIK